MGWIGVDLDGTLAIYGKLVGSKVIGEPIPLMVDRVKRWLIEGKDVRIFTARVDSGSHPYVCLLTGAPLTVEEVTEAIQDWCERHIGKRLPVTNKKDYQMIELWDDRAIGVIPNTGLRTDGLD